MSPEALDIIIGAKRPRHRWMTAAIPDGRGLRRQRRTAIDKVCRMVIMGWKKDPFDYWTHVTFQPYILGQIRGGPDDDD